MKKIIALLGSPRTKGNTNALTDKLIEGIKSSLNSVTVEKINLVDYQGCVCKACGQCRALGECAEYPGINEVLQKIKGTDILIMATPTWWMAPSSQMKIFTDHFGAFLAPDYSSRISGKSAILLSVNGNPEVNFAQQVIGAMENMLQFLGVKVIGSLGVKGVMMEGDVLKSDDILQQAYTLGADLEIKN